MRLGKAICPAVCCRASDGADQQAKAIWLARACAARKCTLLDGPDNDPIIEIDDKPAARIVVIARRHAVLAGRHRIGAANG